MARRAEIQRRTNETEVTLCLDLDEPGTVAIDTGVGFLNHMLTHVAVHGFASLDVKATGDTHVDDHHTVEDVGIAFGQALDRALGGRTGIKRFGEALVPMDETLKRLPVKLTAMREWLARQDWSENPAEEVGSVSA